MERVIVSKMLNTASSATHSLSIENGGRLIPFRCAEMGVHNNRVTVDISGKSYGDCDNSCETPREKLTFLIAFLYTVHGNDTFDVENDGEYTSIVKALQEYSGNNKLGLRVKRDKDDDCWCYYLNHQLVDDYKSIWDIISGTDEYEYVGDDDGSGDWKEKWPSGTGLSIIDFIFNDGVRLTFGRD